MKYVHRILLATSLSWCIGSDVRAQTALPQEIKNAAAFTAQQEQAIVAFVSQSFGKLQGDDIAAQQQSREALTKEASGGAAFIAKYAQAVADGAGAGLAPANSMRVRLNTAIVVARVAETAKSPRLEGPIQLMLNDKHPVIRLWGMKGVRAILPELVKANAHQKLMARIVPAVQQSPSGPMTTEAYEALKILDKAVVEELLKVMALRAELYQKGLPDDPAVDLAPFVFLSTSTVWLSAVPEAQRPRVLEAICQILVLGAYHGDIQGAGTAQREQLQNLVQKTLSSLVVIAKNLGNAELEKAATEALKKATGAGVTLGEAVKPIPPLVKRVRGCENIAVPTLTPPPSTQPITPAN
jgi:hypothetical protein